MEQDPASSSAGAAGCNSAASHDRQVQRAEPHQQAQVAAGPRWRVQQVPDGLYTAATTRGRRYAYTLHTPKLHSCCCCSCILTKICCAIMLLLECVLKLLARPPARSERRQKQQKARKLSCQALTRPPKEQRYVAHIFRYYCADTIHTLCKHAVAAVVALGSNVAHSNVDTCFCRAMLYASTNMFSVQACSAQLHHLLAPHPKCAQTVRAIVALLVLACRA
jgi:hypothetical protein